MESFMLAVFVETAVRELPALWKHSQTHQSIELHLHQCLCVCGYGGGVGGVVYCTCVSIQRVVVKACVGTFPRKINYTSGNTFIVVYIYISFMLRLHQWRGTVIAHQISSHLARVCCSYNGFIDYYRYVSVETRDRGGGVLCIFLLQPLDSIQVPGWS